MQKTQPAGWTGSAGFLVLFFACLKLAHVTDWSWWWVFAPLLGCAAVIAASVALILGTLIAVALRSRA